MIHKKNSKIGHDRQRQIRAMSVIITNASELNTNSHLKKIERFDIRHFFVDHLYYTVL